MSELSTQSTENYLSHAHSHVHESKEKDFDDKQKIKRKIQQQTSDLFTALENYQNEDDDIKQRYFTQALELLKSRQSSIAQLTEIEPNLAAQVYLSDQERKRIPAELQSYVEQEQTLEGALEVFYEDNHETQSSRLRYVLNSGDARTEVKVPEHLAVKGLKSGAKVRVNGVNIKQKGNKLDVVALDDQPSSLMLLADGSSTTSTSGVLSDSVTASSFGEQRTLVMLINFMDNTQTPWTIEEAQEVVFGQVNDFYKENSDNQVWLTGDVVGYYTLPINATCDTWEMHTNAEDVALENGVNTADYDRIVYVFPENTSCGWTGMGTIGGSPSKAYANGSLTLRTVGHELGHNFGLHHAKDLDCGADIIGDRCASAEYGDALDIMGMSGITGHFNAFSKEMLGWISTDSGSVVAVESEGSYTLEPVETARSGQAKGLKIRRGTDEVTGKPLWYYLEYRQDIGFDSFIEGKTGITDGVIFHLATEDDPKSNLMLDMIPDSGLRDLDEAALLVGQSYTDQEAGITITTEWVDASAASVYVSFANAACMPSNPGVTLESSALVSGIAGSSAAYVVNVTNNDNSACAASSFTVNADVPNGWSAAGKSVLLNPGETRSIEVNVTSSDTAQEGSYDIALTAQSDVNNNLSGRVFAAYEIEPNVQACQLANPTLKLVANSTAELEPGSTAAYTATLTNNDSDSCGASSFYINTSAPQGWTTSSESASLAPGETTAIILTVTSSELATAGTYAIDALVSNTVDASYSARATSVYTVADVAPVCEVQPPLIAFNSSLQEGNAGDALLYSVTLTSQEGLDCASKSYSLYADVPNGWSSSISEVTLAAGEKKTVDLIVTSAGSANEGDYALVVNVQSNETGEIISNGKVQYRVLAEANLSPIANDDAVQLTTKEAVEIDVLANDHDPEGRPLSIISYTQGGKGAVSLNSAGHLVYTPAKNFKGRDTFSYTVSDGVNNSTATVSIELSSTTGGGGNKGKGNK